MRNQLFQLLASATRLHNGSFFCLMLLLAFAAFAPSALAETIRVATWNLQPARGETASEAQTIKRAEELKQLSPDVILLQGVSDWRRCAQLVQTLQPEPYRVSICSALRGGSGGGATNLEVGILSRHKTYSCWWKPWAASGAETANAGGFAFAAIQVGKRRVGVFSAELESPAQGAVSSGKLLEQIETVRGWTHNEVDTFIIGGTFMAGINSADAISVALPGLEQRGFVDACLGLPSQPTRSSEEAGFLYVDKTGFPMSPQAAGHGLVMSEIELEPAVVAAARIAHAQERARLAIETAARNQSTSTAAGTQIAAGKPAGLDVMDRQWWLGGILGGAVVVLLAFIWRMARPKRLDFPHPAGLLPSNMEGDGSRSSSYTLVLGPGSVTGSTVEGSEIPTTSGPTMRLDSSPSTQTQSAAWQRRALAAEHQAERAHTIIRKGLLPQLRQWLQQKLVRTLMADRAQMLEAQRAATIQAQTVDERLSRVEQQIQQQNRIYERRIEELTLELLATKEENRELIRGRIAQVRAEMEIAAARVRAQAGQT